ncbi:MAG: DUF5011 domain-containing protein [Bacteroidetes bacterium]|nr:DUF5011 domain-containing protein [Bacteroidota bacterium]
MKKSIALAACVAVSSLFIIGCSKDDTEAPIITLLGSNPLQLEMLDTYTEPGATADDNEDGDISSSISVDPSEIENRLPGTYNVYYSVSDAAGNPADAIREVVVYATNNALAKVYTVNDTCGTGAAAVGFPPYQETVTATSASGGTTIAFAKFANYTNNTGITATVAGNGVITLPTQMTTGIGMPNPENHDFDGTGNVTLNGFILNYNDKNNSATPVATAACRAIYTRN